MKRSVFPLGTVLLPGMALPLRVFEPRYVQMLDDLAGATFDVDDEFVVVLIQRGSEVGGGDQRSSIGCMARIVELRRHPDGAAELLAVGTVPVRVREWLPDDPYPCAHVEGLDQDDAELDPLLRDAAVAAVAKVCSLAFELGLSDEPGLPAMSPDPTAASYQMAMLLPLGPLDRHKVLAESSLDRRHAHIRSLAEEQAELLEARRGR